MKQRAIHRILCFFLFFGMLLATDAQKGCTPEPEEKGIKILLPSEGQNIVGPRTDMYIVFEVPVVDLTFQAEVNGHNVNEFFHVSATEAKGFGVPLAVGANRLEVTIVEEETRALLTGSVDFVAGPAPLSIQQGYIFDVPLDIDPGREGNIPVLTVFADFIRQDGFFAEGTVQALAVDGELLNESPDIGTARAEVWGNEFVMSLENLKLPIEDLLSLVVEPLEAALGINIPLEQSDLDEKTWIDIHLAGTLADTDGDLDADEVLGEITSATLAATYDLGVTGDEVSGYAYTPPMLLTGAFLVDMPFSAGGNSLKLTYHLGIQQNGVTLTGRAVLLGVNDAILVNLPEATPLFGLAFEDAMTINFDVFIPLENQAFLAFLAAMEIPIPQSALEPVFHMALDGKMTPDSEGNVVSIEGSLLVSARYGMAETPGRGTYHGEIPFDDGFSGGRLLDVIVDLSALGVEEPIPMLFCADLMREGALIEGSVNALRANGEPFDVSPGNTGTRGGVIYPDLLLALLALNGSGAKVFYYELNQLYYQQTGQYLPPPPIDQPDIPVEIPDEFQEVTFNLLGEIAEDSTSSGELTGSILWGVPVAVAGSYSAPLIPETTNVSGQHVATLSLNIATGNVGPQEVLLDLTLNQNGCAISGQEEITQIRGRPLPIVEPTTVKGANLGDSVDLVFFDETLADLLEAYPQSSGPAVKIVLRGDISVDSNGNTTINGEVFAAFAYDQIPISVGTFSTVPLQ